MKKQILLFAALALLGLGNATAAPAAVTTYTGELNGIPCKAWLWWDGDDVVGFLDRVDGKPMTLRLAGENRTQGKMTLKAMQAYSDVGIMRLTRLKQNGVTVWSGMIQFKDGTSLNVMLKKS